MLIDAALKLCLEQGYERTTVDQIAAIADVSPRTFSRYFPTKDGVVLTLIDDLVDAAAIELAKVPREVPALEALLRAHVEVLRSVPSDSVAPLTTERIALMVNIINSVGALQQAAGDFRPRMIVLNLAERVDVGWDEPKLRLVTAVWSTIVVTALANLVIGPDDVELGPELMAERLSRTFTLFSELTEKLPHRV